jgi:hypothetical protein
MKVIPLPPIFILDADQLSQLNSIIGCFFFAFTGAYIRETVCMYTGVQKEASLHKIIIGTIIGGALFNGLRDKYFIDFSLISITIINIISGTVGYEVFSKCSSIENIKQLARDIHDIIKSIVGIDDVLDDKKKDNDDKK